MARRLLIVGDDLDTTEVLTHCLEALGCTVENETVATQVIARIRAHPYAGIILILTIPGARWVTVLQQLRQGGSTIPVVAISEDPTEDELMREGAQAVLRKPCEGRKLKRVLQRVIPPTRDELIRYHGGGEHTIGLHAQALAKAGDFFEARHAIALLDDENSQRMAYIQLLSYQVQAGDLEGAKATVHGAPSLRIGGHWVRCMTNALVQAGDVRGAWAIADHITSVEERSFIKGIIVARQTADGDLLGAKASFFQLSPRESIRSSSAAGTITRALAMAGDVDDALRFVCAIETDLVRRFALNVLFQVAMQKRGRAEAERLAARLESEELRHEGRTVIQTLEQGDDEATNFVKACEINFTHDTFANLYPVELGWFFPVRGFLCTRHAPVPNSFAAQRIVRHLIEYIVPLLMFLGIAPHPALPHSFRFFRDKLDRFEGNSWTFGLAWQDVTRRGSQSHPRRLECATYRPPGPLISTPRWRTTGIESRQPHLRPETERKGTNLRRRMRIPEASG